MVLALVIGFCRLGRTGKNASGQALVEYSLLLALVAAMIIAISVFVGGTDGIVRDIGTALETAIE